MGSLLGVASPRDSYPLSESDAQSCFCLRASDRLRLQRTRSYFVWCLPGACCLIPTEGTPCFQRGRTLEPPVSGARLHWGQNQCADTCHCSETQAATARIHSLSGIAPAPRINIDHPIVVVIQCLLFESKSKRAHTGVPAELSVSVGSERNSAQSATDC
jgi:hypothetical protein